MPLRGRACTPTLCPLCARTRPQAGKAGRLAVCAIRRPQAAFLASPARERPQRTGEAPPHGASVSWPCDRRALCARPPPRKIFPPCVREVLGPVSRADTPATAGGGGYAAPAGAQVGHSKPQRSKKGHTTKTPAGALLQIAVTIAAMVAPPSAGPLVRPCVFDYLHGSLWPVTLQGLPPCFSVPFPKVISYYK